MKEGKMPGHLALLTVLIACSLAVHAQNNEIPRPCPSVFTMHKRGETQAIGYASNHPLDKLDTTVTTLLIYIHGTKRDAVSHFEYAEHMVKSARRKKETLVISPQYPNAGDLDYYKLANDFLYWKKTAWKDGYTSTTEEGRPQHISISSFEVMDSLVNFVLTSHYFPNIKRVVISGHSGGGQFVQRYSAITPIPDLLTGYQFRFIVINPAFYMYPDDKRPIRKLTFGVPDITACPDYNRYPKGLANLNNYAKATGAARILDNMVHRDIVFLLGEDDIREEELDVSCAANLQGPERLDRGANYITYIMSFPGYPYKKNYDIVSGSGHNPDKMINSSEAKKWVFGK